MAYTKGTEKKLSNNKCCIDWHFGMLENSVQISEQSVHKTAHCRGIKYINIYVMCKI